MEIVRLLKESVFKSESVTGVKSLALLFGIIIMEMKAEYLWIE